MLNDALDSISPPELRRRVDRAVALLRDMRHAIAVQAGMTLEDAPGPIPQFDVEDGKRCLAQLMETLPLLRERLTPEERAELHPVSAAQKDRMKAVLDEALAHKDIFEQVTRETDSSVSYEQMVKLRERLDKMELIRGFERELSAHLEQFRALRRSLEELVGAAGAASDEDH